ncbi:hypothetical protein ACWGH2_16180 [Streptomyces sp. NPDC054871]
MPIAVQRAENYYVPPYPNPADAWVDVPGAELVYAWLEARTGRRIKRPDEVLADEPAIWARISQNRWVADCVCGSASMISLTDPRWGCTECGYGWVPLIVPTPEVAEAAEAQLVTIVRPHLRNWWQPDDPHPMNPSRPVPEEPGEDLPTVTR